MTTQLFNITVPTTMEESTTSLMYDFALLSKPIFFNSEAYNSFNPVIKQVFNNDATNAKIPTCDFMTYMFPIDNTIQFTDNQNVIIKYTPYYIHFTHTCPIIFTSTSITPSKFSLIIECMSESNIPLLIIIPVDYTNTDSNTTVDLLIQYSQSTQSSIAAAPTNNIYLNNIIPPEQFIYFKKPVSTSIVNCNIITFPTSLKTKFSPNTTISISAAPSVEFDNFDTDSATPEVNTLISTNSVNSALYVEVPTPPSTAPYPSSTIIVPINIYKSSNTPYNSPSITENDIYIDCSVVTDTTTPTTKILPTTSTTAKNSAAFIMFLIIIFITSLFIYKWIFMSNTSISKPTSSIKG